MRLALTMTILLGAAGSAWADDCPANPELRTYDKPATLPGIDTRCDMDKGKCTKLELKGYLFMPAKPEVVPYATITRLQVATVGAAQLAKAPAGHPILIYNHGSEQVPGQSCELGTYFSSLGYVVFVPHRRGHGKSTGIYLDRYIKEFCSPALRGQGGPCKMEYLHKQVNDVQSATAYVKTLPGVDPTNIAIMGHSFGGIVSAFANTKDLGQRAIVEVAGGSQSWAGNAEASKQLAEAVRAAVAPAFFFEPLNDKSIDPTLDLAHAAGEACRQFQSAILPAIDANEDSKIDVNDYQGDIGDGKTIRDRAHGRTMKHLEMWGPAANEFMTRYFLTPAAPFDSLCKGTSHAGK